MHCLNMIMVPSLRCAFTDGYNSVSMMILNLRITEENLSMFVKGLFIVKKFKCKNRHGCCVTVILMSPISICMELFSCVTGVDVFNKVSVTD